MQNIPSVGGRQLRLLGVAALIGLASFGQAQVSLSELAKAVAETGANVSSRGHSNDSETSKAATESSLANGTLTAPGAGTVTSGSTRTPQLDHVAVGPTTFNGDQKFVRPSSTDKTPDNASAGAAFMNTMSSGGSASGGGMDSADAERLATRRELAVGIAGAGGLFLFGVWIATHVTRTRRMAMSHRD